MHPYRLPGCLLGTRRERETNQSVNQPTIGQLRKEEQERGVETREQSEIREAVERV